MRHLDAQYENCVTRWTENQNPQTDWRFQIFSIFSNKTQNSMDDFPNLSHTNPQRSTRVPNDNDSLFSGATLHTTASTTYLHVNLLPIIGNHFFAILNLNFAFVHVAFGFESFEHCRRRWCRRRNANIFCVIQLTLHYFQLEDKMGQKRSPHIYSSTMLKGIRRSADRRKSLAPFIIKPSHHWLSGNQMGKRNCFSPFTREMVPRSSHSVRNLKNVGHAFHSNITNDFARDNASDFSWWLSKWIQLHNT